MFVSPIGAKASGTSLWGWRCVFIQGHDPTLEAKAKEIETTWTKAIADMSWTAWGDFHDGTYFTLNISNAFEDAFDNWVFQTGSAYGFSRIYLPGTTWTYEGIDKAWDWRGTGETLPCTDEGVQVIDYVPDSPHIWEIKGEGRDAGLCNEGAAQYLKDHSWSIDEPGRNPVNQDHSSKFLWKITYAVANASSAREFAKDFLGAVDRTSPFPYPPSQGEDGAYWLYLTEGLLELHFVESGNLTQHEMIREWHEMHESKAKQLRSGCISPFLYNNANLRVDTLDPFVEKLQEKEMPYLATTVGDSDYALLFAFPGNEAIVFQLTSDHLTKTTPTPRNTVLECA